MRTIICTHPGKLDMIEREHPRPAESELLVRVRRIGVCGTDLHAFEGTQPYFSYPRVLGHELAATIVETGHGFTAGEAVTVLPYFHCGHCIACRNGKPNCCVNLRVCGVHIDGGMTELLSVPADCVIKGGGLSLDELALAEPLAIGAHGVKRAGIRPGENVLIMGAGPIGLGIVAFTIMTGGEAIVVDRNVERLAFCKSQFRVKACIDASSLDATQALSDLTRGDMATVVIDATGNLAAMQKGFDYLAHGARYVLVGLQREQIAVDHPAFHKREATLMSSRNASRKDFEWVMQSIAERKIDPLTFVTHRTQLENVPEQFPTWLDPGNRVIKALISL